MTSDFPHKTAPRPLRAEPKVLDAEAILQQRARQLATSREVIRESGPTLDLVRFRLAHELYALEASYISEVYPLKELTPIPGTPSFVLGIINLRGRILSILDLKRFFDLPIKGITDLNKVLVVASAEMEFGLLADRIEDDCRIPLSELQNGPPTLSGRRREYLKGIACDGTIVLDAARILADPAMIVDHGRDG